MFLGREFQTEGPGRAKLWSPQGSNREAEMARRLRVSVERSVRVDLYGTSSSFRYRPTLAPVHAVGLAMVGEDEF